MTPTEAAFILREAMKNDDSHLARALASALDAKGYTDLYDFVEQCPALAIDLAQSELEAQAELAEYARALEKGALGARQDDQPST